MLGRDATSVFPTESKTDVSKSDAAKEMLGSSNRFITETEVACFSTGMCIILLQRTYEAHNIVSLNRHRCRDDVHLGHPEGMIVCSTGTQSCCLSASAVRHECPLGNSWCAATSFQRILHMPLQDSRS